VAELAETDGHAVVDVRDEEVIADRSLLRSH
jgi:hypothetical protein